MKGELHGRAVVNRNQVAWIRRSYQPNLKGGGHQEIWGSISHMARTVGLSRRQVKRIVRKENWK